jgi:hypothetical protein
MVQMQDRETVGVGRVVHFNVARNKQALIENEVFYSDSSAFIYPDLKYSWVSESVLRFGEFDTSIKADEVSVINQTNKIVRYLRVNAGNEYLLLEIQPQTTTRLFDRPQTDKTADISWIGGFGKFDDGAGVSGWGMNFHIRGKYTSSAHYCVFIRDGGVIVQSKEFEGFGTDESGSTVEKPEAKNPNCQ